MEIMLGLLVMLILFDLAALRWGIDSRDTLKNLAKNKLLK
jgi:hypothetical protein